MVKATKLDEIQWGMFSFQPEAYVSLGMLMLQFLPHWSGSTAIMTTIVSVIMAHMMIHPIQHQHIIIRLLCIILASYCSMITPLQFL